MIEIEHLSSCYGKKEILKDLSFTIPEGKVIGIVGKNGSGKTTLLKVIDSLIPYVGVVRIDGRSDLKRGERARFLAYLPQIRPLPDLSVMNLVLHGRYPFHKAPRTLSEHDKEICLKELNRLGISDFETKRVIELSGGERQKVYLAMCLAQETKYLLMDEPTTFMDIDAKLDMWHQIQGLSRLGKTSIVVTHDIADAMNYCDEIIALEDGKLAFQEKKDSEAMISQMEELFHVKVLKIEDEFILKRKEDIK